MDHQEKRRVLDVADVAERSGQPQTLARQPMSLRLSPAERNYEDMISIAEMAGDLKGLGFSGIPSFRFYRDISMT